MTGLLQDKVTVITGAGSGIGRAMALLFAREGATIVAVDISGQESALTEELGTPAVSFNLDVGDEEKVGWLFDRVAERFGRVDIVCNNAARSSGFGPLHETGTDILDEVIRINMRGAFIVMQKSIAMMLQSGGGAIVNTASLSSFHSTPGHGAYAATKGGVMSMTRSAAIEYADRNIRVNALCPGVIETPLIAGATQDARDNILRMIPMKRFGSPDEVARVGLFLASDLASYVTGIGLVADGGRSAG